MPVGTSSPYNLRASARKRTLSCDGTTPGGHATGGKISRLESPGKADEDAVQDKEEQRRTFFPGLYRDLSM